MTSKHLPKRLIDTHRLIIMTFKRVNILIPGTCDNVSWLRKRGFAGVMRLRALGGQVVWGYRGQPHVITPFLYKTGEGGEPLKQRSERLEDAALPALKTEPRAVSHGARVAPESWERQGNPCL